LLIVVGYGVYIYLSVQPGALNVICRHNFQSADISVSVDGRPVFTEQVSGTVKKRFGILDRKTEGNFSKTLNIPEGEHVVSVRVNSTAEKFDQTKQASVNIISGKEASVLVSAQKSELSLVYRGSPVNSGQDNGSGYLSTLRSIVMTVMGSIASAAIGFAVQDFLKSRKAALTAARNSK
jgi:hypothetical protein